MQTDRFPRAQQDRRSSDRLALDEGLSPSLYNSLRSLARLRMRGEAPGTLQPTALAHEAYVRLHARPTRWESRRYFYAAADRAMRRILIERARERQSLKRGGKLRRMNYEDCLGETLAAAPATPTRLHEIVTLERALEKLRIKNRRLAETVELRFFSGLSVEETSVALEVSTRTVKKDWAFARAWLAREMS